MSSMLWPPSTSTETAPRSPRASTSRSVHPPTYELSGLPLFPNLTKRLISSSSSSSSSTLGLLREPPEERPLPGHARGLRHVRYVLQISSHPPTHLFQSTHPPTHPPTSSNPTTHPPTHFLSKQRVWLCSCEASAPSLSIPFQLPRPGGPWPWRY